MSRDLSPEEAAAVLLEVADGVAVVTLNRPDRLNAVDHTIRAAFPARMEEAADREDVRVIVVTGAGRGFCAGADFRVLDSLGSGDRRPLPGRDYLVARTIPKPVIAAVNGPCAGIGLVFALACDLRFTSAGVKFGTGFASRGLVAEQGLAWLLARTVGPSRALDLLFTARTFRGAEAHDLGLVDGLHEDGAVREETLRYARALAAGSSAVSMGVMKWQVQRATESSLWEAVDDAEEITLRSFAGRDFVRFGSGAAATGPGGFPPIPPGRLGEAAPVDLIPPDAGPDGPDRPD